MSSEQMSGVGPCVAMDKLGRVTGFTHISWMPGAQWHPSGSLDLLPLQGCRVTSWDFSVVGRAGPTLLQVLTWRVGQ